MPYQNSKQNRSGQAVVERRYCTTELRAETEQDKRKITGHFAVFNSSAELGWFIESIAPGAFAETIKTDDIRALWNHEPNWILGRNKSGTLSLFEDDRGLFGEIIPPDTQWARDLQVSIERGDVSQASFGFEVIEEAWEIKNDEPDLRVIKKAKLWDVSPVTFPAYTDTNVAMRNHAAWQKQRSVVPLRVRERLLNLNINHRGGK